MYTFSVDNLIKTLSLSPKQEEKLRTLLQRGNISAAQNEAETVSDAHYPTLSYEELPDPSQKTLSDKTLPESHLKINLQKTQFQHTSTPPEDTISLYSQSTPSPESNHYPQQKGILEHYQYISQLGVGGMGEVYKVYDKRLNRTLAMKIMHPSLLKHHAATDRFVAEAQISAQLQHPNTVPIYDIGALPDGRMYFTMKEIRGETFGELIDNLHANIIPSNSMNSQKTSFRGLVQIFHSICTTMDYAHTMGVIHRDLKPDNIMVGDFGEVLVVDWGIAKVKGEAIPNSHSADFVETDRSKGLRPKSQAGLIAGTIVYMSPEQALGKEVDFRSDIYSLGSILYELLISVPPYEGPNPSQIIEKVRKGNFTPFPNEARTNRTAGHTSKLSEPSTPPFSSLIPHPLPSELVDICKKSMSLDPDLRYQSAKELAEAVQSWLDGAHKREKGLKQIQKAKQARQRAKLLKEQALLLWQKAQENFSNIEDSWALWTQSKSLKKHAHKEEQEYLRFLQGALIFSPNLQEAHLLLARLALDKIISSASGDKKEQNRAKHSFAHHLSFLRLEEKEKLQKEYKKKCEDPLSNLQAQQKDLIGRRKEKERLLSQIKTSSQLITIIGTAGVGKTRLALELVNLKRSTELQNRVLFCDLTEAKSKLDIARKIASYLNISLQEENSIEQIASILRQSPTLLILDNLEHILSEAKTLIQSWLHIRNLQIIATSRTKVHLPQEYSIVLNPLSVLEAIELFSIRAQEALHSFVLTEKNRTRVQKLVEQLDCLPLAIELAAARLSILSLSDISKRLQQRFSLLRSRSAGKETQALQGALDWSWDLLKPWDREVLAQSSIFHGGFTFGAAEAVIQPQSSEAPAVVDILQDLCEVHLLQKERDIFGFVRYRLLESIRAYAASRLENDDFRDRSIGAKTRKRHAEYFSQFGDYNFLSSLDTNESEQRWSLFYKEFDNCVAGSLVGQNQTAVLCAIAAIHITTQKGPFSLGLEISKRILQQQDLQETHKLQIQLLTSNIMHEAGKIEEARSYCSKILEHSKSNKESDPIKSNIFAMTHIELGKLDALQSHYDRAEASFQQALNLFHETSSAYGEAISIAALGSIHDYKNQYEEACDKYLQGITLLKKVGNQNKVGDLYANLGLVLIRKGQHTQAIDYLQQAVDIHSKLGKKRCVAINLGSMGNLYRRQGNYKKSKRFLNQALSLHREVGNRVYETYTLGYLGFVHQELGQYDEAMESYQAAKVILVQMGMRRSLASTLGNIATLLQLQGELDSALEYHHEALQICKDIEDKRSQGINLGNMGVLYFKLDKHAAAEEHLSMAIDICDHYFQGASGYFKGTLAIILADRGDFDGAHRLLESGEIQVTPLREPYANFLCNKARVFLLQNRKQETQELLKQIEEHARELNPSPASELGRAISALKESMLAEDP